MDTVELNLNNLGCACINNDKSFYKKILYIDGVSCVGKTTMLEQLNKSEGISISYNDLKERCQYIYNEFSDKHNCNILQSAYNLLNIHLRPKDNCCIVDRSPLSDLWYTIIFKILECMKKEKMTSTSLLKILQKGEMKAQEELNKILFIEPYKLINEKSFHISNNNSNNDNIILKMILKDIISMYQTLVVIPHHDHVPQILKKMKIRNNGIDILDPLFIHAQIILFDSLKKYYDLPNFQFYNIDFDVKLFSDQHVKHFKFLILNLFYKQDKDLVK